MRPVVPRAIPRISATIFFKTVEVGSEWKGLTDKTTRGQSAAGRRTAAFAAGGRCLERQDVHDRPAHHGAGSARARIASRYPALSLECSTRDDLARYMRTVAKLSRGAATPTRSTRGSIHFRCGSGCWRRMAISITKSCSLRTGAPPPGMAFSAIPVPS